MIYNNIFLYILLSGFSPPLLSTPRFYDFYMWGYENMGENPDNSNLPYASSIVSVSMSVPKMIENYPE